MQSRRQRNEQRKVARLVLETSTHGGHSYMSPEELEERQQAQQPQEQQQRQQQQQQQGHGGAAASASGQQLDKSGSLIGKLKGSLSGVKRALGSWSSSSDAGSSHGGTAHAAGKRLGRCTHGVVVWPIMQSHKPLTGKQLVLARCTRCLRT